MDEKFWTVLQHECKNCIPMCFFIRKEKGNQKQDTKEDSYSYYSVIKTRPDCMEIFYRSTWQWNKIFDHDEIPIKMSPGSRPIPRGDTMILNKNFFDRKFFKTGPWCAEGSIWRGKNKTSPLKKSWIDEKAEKCQKFWLRNRFQNQLDSINQFLLHVKFFNS